MHSDQFTKHQTIPFIKALKNDYMIYYIERPATAPEKMSEIMSSIGTLCTKVHDRLLKKELPVNSPDFQLHMKMPKDCYSYTSLFPHLRPGHSPFVFSKKDGEIQGVLVCFGEESRTYCEKTITKYAEKHFEMENLKEQGITMGAAKVAVRDALEAGKKEIGGEEMYIPLVVKKNTRYIYLDLVNNYALLKTGVKQNLALQEVFELLRRVYETLNEEKSFGIEDLCKDLFSERLQISHYTRQAIGKGEVTQPYYLTNLVEYYAHQNNHEKAEGVTPLMTANFVSKDEAHNEIRFKNTVTMILSDEDRDTLQKESPFRILGHISRVKNLDIKSLLMTGELARTSQIDEYVTMFPEDEDPALKLSHLPITYQTQSKEGNIRFAIKHGIDLHIGCFKSIIREKMHDQHYSPINREIMFLDYMGELLPLLHESTNLFIELYHGAFNVSESEDKFDSVKESPLEAALV